MWLTEAKTKLRVHPECSHVLYFLSKVSTSIPRHTLKFQKNKNFVAILKMKFRLVLFPNFVTQDRFDFQYELLQNVNLVVRHAKHNLVSLHVSDVKT